MYTTSKSHISLSLTHYSVLSLGIVTAQKYHRSVRRMLKRPPAGHFFLFLCYIFIFRNCTQYIRMKILIFLLFEKCSSQEVLTFCSRGSIKVCVHFRKTILHILRNIHDIFKKILMYKKMIVTLKNVHSNKNVRMF